MYIKFVLLLTASFHCVSITETKKFETCEFAQKLLDYGLVSTNASDKLTQLGNWVCLAFMESTLNTKHICSRTDGSKDYGIFQINNYYWCDDNVGKSNDCKINCTELLTDNIEKAVDCANIIYKRHGFEAWHAWDFCGGWMDITVYIKGCNF